LLPLLTLILYLGAAHAGEDECVACCRAAGLSGCRTSIRMYGEGSVASAEAGAWRIMGLWFLDCDGQGRFEAGSTVVLPEMPVSGELLISTSPRGAFHCFSQACSFPEQACFERLGGDRLRLVDCRDGAPMPAVQLAQPGPTPPGSETIIVVVGARPLVVTPVTPQPSKALSPPAGACCGSPQGGSLFGAEVQRAVVVQREIEPGGSSALPSPSAERDRGRDAAGRFVLEIPEPPLSSSCDTAEMLRTESRRRVDVGNETELAGNVQQAIDEYRAAITLDPCNPYAWADLGALALKLDRAPQAALALSQAVEQQPRHYTAFSNLGLAYEALGQPALARQAFAAALALRPHHQPAIEGLERTSTPRGGP
jgi:hypothetical protein